MDIKKIQEAQTRIRPYLPVTPLLYSTHLQQALNKHVWLKLETQLPTGSFKPRPALNSILTELDMARQHGVVASSSGNFAQGVAYAARELQISAIIVMMESTSPYKIHRTKALGAEVVLCGNTSQERIETTQRIQRETGRLLLEPYDSIPTVEGDSTIALELAEQLGDQLNHMTILVPISGGGLLAGIAFTLKTLYPTCTMIGIQPENNGSMAKSFQAGTCINVGKVDTVADALVASMPGAIPFAIIRDYVDDIVLVSEEEINQATRYMIDQHKLVIEPAGAIPIAALFAQKVTAKDVVCVVSGGNINLLG